MGEAGHSLFEGSLVLHADNDERVGFSRGVRVLQGGFVGSVIALDENLLDREIIADESVNPVFVLQHGDSSWLDARGVLPPRAGLQ